MSRPSPIISMSSAVVVVRPTPTARGPEEDRSKTFATLRMPAESLIPTTRHHHRPVRDKSSSYRRSSPSPRFFVSFSIPTSSIMLAILLDLVSRRRISGFTPLSRPGSSMVTFRKSSSSSSQPRAPRRAKASTTISTPSAIDIDGNILAAAINGTAFVSPALSSIPLNDNTMSPLNHHDAPSTSFGPAAFAVDELGTLAAINGTSLAFSPLFAMNSTIHLSHLPHSDTNTNNNSAVPPFEHEESPLRMEDNNDGQQSSLLSTTETLFKAQDFNITIPKVLSPSALKEYEQCPQSFFFQYILKLKQPTNTALAKGSMCHTALEEFLGLDMTDRSLTVLHNLYRKAWAQHRTTDTYKGLFASVDAEREWGTAGLACLSRYYQYEPQVPAPNPVQRETWVRAALADNITVRGIVDRLDLVRDVEGSGEVVLRLMDYKTGKAPDLKYSPGMNAKIEREAWDQLVLYSLLLRESKNTPIRFLRLIYLGGDGDDDAAPATIWDKRLEQSEMDDMKAKVLQLWSEIVDKLSSDDPFTAFSGCHRSFCYCHKCRTRFADDSVWQPSDTTCAPVTTNNISKRMVR